jgi:two-component system, cell cycle response regulator
MGTADSLAAWTRSSTASPTPADVGGDAVPELAPPEVLLVDGNPTARERLRLMLESAGYAVTTAGNGSEALECLRRRFIPLLITDIVMPEMGGLELCRELRSLSLPSHLYTIVLSLCDDPEQIVEGLAAGADAYISKRATKSQVLATLGVGRRLVGQDQALRRAVLKNSLLADMDDLTGSGNRRYVNRGLERELAWCAQHGEWLSVLMCNLDHFKPINERFGHAVGDEILQAFVARVRGILTREGGWLGHYGGGDFVIVLAATPLGRARLEARHIREAVAEEPLLCSAGALPVTVSIGVTGVGPVQLRQSVRVAELLEQTDHCLYESKAHGRDTITARRFHPVNQALREPGWRASRPALATHRGRATG